MKGESVLDADYYYRSLIGCKMPASPYFENNE